MIGIGILVTPDQNIQSQVLNSYLKTALSLSSIFQHRSTKCQHSQCSQRRQRRRATVYANWVNKVGNESLVNFQFISLLTNTTVFHAELILNTSFLWVKEGHQISYSR